jgi:cobalamin-dependent methionine synthase I
MVAALFALEGAYCFTLGPQTPVAEIANAVKARAIDVVVLSFSIIYPSRRIPPALAELRQRLAPAVEIWAGGAGTARLRRAPAGTRLLPTLEDALVALGHWRSVNAGLLSSEFLAEVGSQT